MAENDGAGEDEGANTAVEPVVDVGAADAGLRDADDDGVGRIDLGGRCGGVRKGVDFFEEE